MRRYVRRYGVPSDGFVLGDNEGAWSVFEHIRPCAPPLRGTYSYRERVWNVGVDALALELCKREGWGYEVHVAEWGVYGRSAGFRRNAQMVAACRPGDHALAFPDPFRPSKGTWHCAGLATDAKLLVTVVPHVRRIRPVVHAPVPALAA
jgi:hypothetical protein